MTLAEIRDILDAEVIVGEDKLGLDIRTAFGADLMSDVLAFSRAGCLLITGLANPQTVRAAYALDIAAILVCRGKPLSDKFLELSRELGIPILSTKYIMFETCGKLFQKGITGCIREVHLEEKLSAK